MHFHRASIARLAILLVVTLATAAGIAAGAPYRPASIWFPLQSLFERGQLRLQSTAETRAEYALGIAERRGADVVWALKGKYFDLTLNSSTHVVGD